VSVGQLGKGRPGHRAPYLGLLLAGVVWFNEVTITPSTLPSPFPLAEWGDYMALCTQLSPLR